jgi:hypothetical protein
VKTDETGLPADSELQPEIGFPTYFRKKNAQASVGAFFRFQLKLEMTTKFPLYKPLFLEENTKSSKSL